MSRTCDSRLLLTTHFSVTLCPGRVGCDGASAIREEPAGRGADRDRRSWRSASASPPPSSPTTPTTPPPSSPPPTPSIANWIGYYGATIAWIFVGFFGFASLLFPGALLVIGWNRFWGKELEYLQTKLIGFMILVARAAAAVRSGVRQALVPRRARSRPAATSGRRSTAPHRRT